jgi:hypothetical protein
MSMGKGRYSRRESRRGRNSPQAIAISMVSHNIKNNGDFIPYI